VFVYILLATVKILKCQLQILKCQCSWTFLVEIRGNPKQKYFVVRTTLNTCIGYCLLGYAFWRKVFIVDLCEFG
jgi:hypothetical protein